MARIAGIDLPRRKAIVYALPYIYGIGNATARKLCKLAKVPEDRKVDELSEADVKSIRDAIDGSIKVEGDARREVQQNIKRLMDLGSYRGLRHRKGLPRQWATHPDQRTHPARVRARAWRVAPKRLGTFKANSWQLPKPVFRKK